MCEHVLDDPCASATDACGAYTCTDIGVAIAMVCIDRLGRRGTQVAMYGLCAIITPLLALMMKIEAPLAPFLLMAMLARLLVMGASSVTWVYPAEVSRALASVLSWRSPGWLGWAVGAHSFTQRLCALLVIRQRTQQQESEVGWLGSPQAHVAGAHSGRGRLLRQLSPHRTCQVWARRRSGSLLPSSESPTRLLVLATCC